LASSRAWKCGACSAAGASTSVACFSRPRGKANFGFAPGRAATGFMRLLTGNCWTARTSLSALPAGSSQDLRRNLRLPDPAAADHQWRIAGDSELRRPRLALHETRPSCRRETGSSRNARNPGARFHGVPFYRRITAFPALAVPSARSSRADTARGRRHSQPLTVISPAPESRARLARSARRFEADLEWLTGYLKVDLDASHGRRS
jgi:hypothetical protein